MAWRSAESLLRSFGSGAARAPSLGFPPAPLSRLHPPQSALPSRHFASFAASRNLGKLGCTQSSSTLYSVVAAARLSSHLIVNVRAFCELPNGGGGGDEWLTAEGYKAWNFADETKDNVFNIGEAVHGIGETEVHISRSLEIERSEENNQLEMEEKQLTAILKGPDRAFGDLIAASGITDEMLDSLIALRDFQGVEGLPPLSELEDMRYEKNTRKSTRAEIERQKQEEVAKSRVRQVDDNGRAYGTGRRKCSIARVWVSPGDGKFLVNDKEFDVYFPVLDHRAALLRPFSETKTLGLWDVNCTVKGGGVTGQVGAIQLGISRALQNWEPDLRPPLRSAGFLTRDPRVVERKKPGKAKARKSFQWVKR